jgi:hypothetical protein
MEERMVTDSKMSSQKVNSSPIMGRKISLCLAQLSGIKPSQKKEMIWSLSSKTHSGGLTP